jgi:3-oxoacid CoA-transferase
MLNISTVKKCIGKYIHLDVGSEAPLDKVVARAVDAVADIEDGASIVFGGFGVPHNWPGSLIVALRDRGVGNLTAVANTLGFGPFAPQILAENHQITRLIASFGGLATRQTAIADQIKSGEVQFEPVPQGTLVERLRAGGAGLPAFFTPTGVGTQIADGKEVRTFDGREYVMETALRPQFAFIRAAKADRHGNLVYHGSTRNFHPIFAMGGQITIAEVDEIVEPGELDPDQVVTPGIFVDRVVKTEIPLADSLAVLRSMGRDPFGSRTPVSDEGRIGITRDMMALRTAKELQGLRYVNLGIGLPTLVSNYLDAEAGPFLHAEHGVLGYGRFAEEGAEDWDIYNAGGQIVTVNDGASFFHSVDAFTMARGGRLDAVVLGAFQVSVRGDLANWWAPHMSAGGIGGAMDLAVGAPRLIALMEHVAKDGTSKVVNECTYPLTAGRCVTTIITDLAVIDVDGGGLTLREVAPGVSAEYVQSVTEPTLRISGTTPEMEF